MKRYFPGLLLAAILLLGLISRLMFLGRIPGGFTPDEASQGYAAYSLLHTGTDEWGVTWPFTAFRAFGDYRAPLQTYLMIPFIAIFGLTEFAVRLPSALFGSLAILAIYLLANELFAARRLKVLGMELTVGHLAAFFLLISPWHFQFSRTALEANLGSFLFPLGLYFLLKGLRGNRGLLILAGIFLGFDLYSYLAAKLFVPLFLIAFALPRRRELIKLGWRNLLPALLIFAALVLPIYADALVGSGNVRGKDLIITNLTREDLVQINQEQFFSPLARVSPTLVRGFDNKLTFVLKSFSDNYLSYLSPTFWFSEGGRETTYSVFPGHGLLPLWFLPFLLVAFYYLISGKHPNAYLLFAWLLIGIIPAAITKLGYRPNRVGSLLGFWEIMAAFGFVQVYTRFRISQVVSLLIAGVILVSLIFYLNLYFFASTIKYPSALSYGYRDLVAKLNQHRTKGENLIIDKGEESHIFLAFYNRLDPVAFQTDSAVWWNEFRAKKLLFIDMLDPYRLGGVTFKTFDHCTDLLANNLVVIKAAKMKDSFKAYVIDTVFYPDQTPAFYLVTYNPVSDPLNKVTSDCPKY